MQADCLGVHCDYVAAPAAAYDWIRETFVGQLLRIQGGPRDVWGQSGALLRAVRQKAAKAVVAVPRGEGDWWAGWAASLDGALLFAYVRADFRRNGIGIRLTRHATTASPVDVAYWTEDAQRMAAHGVDLRYSHDAYQALLSFVRGRELRRVA